MNAALLLLLPACLVSLPARVEAQAGYPQTSSSVASGGGVTRVGGASSVPVTVSTPVAPTPGQAAQAAGRGGGGQPAQQTQQGQGVQQTQGVPISSTAMPAPYVQPYDPYAATPASILDRAAPLSPEEIVRLRTTLHERSQAFQINVTKQPPPKPTSSRVDLELSPGGAPPSVRVSMRQGATLVFVDAAGRPWPVESADNFNDVGYQITQLAEHVFTVGMRRDNEIGSAVFKLRDIARPVSVTIQPAQAETDYSVDLVVPKFLGGLPPAGISSASAVPSHMAADMLAFLYRTPPDTAIPLRVEGAAAGDVQAWQISPSMMMVRSVHEVVSPAHYRRQGSIDGVSVFQIPLTSVVTVSQAGSLRSVQFAGLRVDSAAGMSRSAPVVLDAPASAASLRAGRAGTPKAN